MNMLSKQDSDILYSLFLEPFVNQRILAEVSGHSLGVVNKSLKKMIKNGYLDEEVRLTSRSRDLFKDATPLNAIIMAAGFGMRMVPINTETPKALLEVNGETLIERLIRQLHEVDIIDITIIVGFMKDSFEYLIDEYGVRLVYNENYGEKNNIASLDLVREKISNTYILPCDLWCDYNPFRRHELYSWYMVSDMVDEASDVRVNRKMELVRIPERFGGNAMVGIAYLMEKEAKIVRERLHAYAANKLYDKKFWEETLYGRDRMILQARVVHSSDIVEIDTFEQLRDLDSDSNQLKSDVLKIIAKQINTRTDEIIDIAILKKGMTNRSFIFTCKGNRYIMRIPGEGTEKLIDRATETEVYRVINGLGFCDNPVYINPENGYKLTRYLEGVRNCNAYNENDVKRAMEKLRKFHSKRLVVGHTFDLFKRIQDYEDMWDGTPSIYRDYEKTKENVFSLRSFIESARTDWCLTHIDAVADNFLFYPHKDENGVVVGEDLQLTDWEYAGMQDPDLDLAMFSIYSFYDKEHIDHLIEVYFGDNGCDQATRVKIYCYIAAGGLLWSNWCEYKRNLGIEFGEYSLRQYRFAKDFYRIAIAEGKDFIKLYEEEGKE